MKVIGLTGGIATGKSTVTSFLKEFNTFIIDADSIAREIVEVGEPALEEIVSRFGEEILTEENQLDRRKLGKIVFKNKEKLEILNAITHPRILNEIQKRIWNLKKTKDYPIVVIDVALLIEMNMMNLVDEVWLVTTDEEKQINRIMARDNLSREEASRRIKSQMPSDLKAQYADVILENNDDLKTLKDKVKQEINRVYNS